MHCTTANSLPHSGHYALRYVAYALVIAVHWVGAASPCLAQSSDGDQSLLREARGAAEGSAAYREPVADRYVAPATFDAGARDLPATLPAKGQSETKPAGRLLPPRPASMRKPGESGEPSSTADVAAIVNNHSLSPTTLVGSTCVVLSIFFAAAWLMKRAAPKSMQSLPGGAIEVLGRAPLVRGQHLQLVRCGSRLLLLAVSATTAQTLSEISDPTEVDALLSACGGKGSPRGLRESNHQGQRDEYSASTDRVGELLATVTGGAGTRELVRGGRHA